MLHLQSFSMLIRIRVSCKNFFFLFALWLTFFFFSSPNTKDLIALPRRRYCTHTLPLTKKPYHWNK